MISLRVILKLTQIVQAHPRLVPAMFVATVLALFCLAVVGAIAMIHAALWQWFVFAAAVLATFLLFSRKRAT